MTGKSTKIGGGRQCEFFLVRYVADRMKGEFVNIGVLLRETAKLDGQTSGPIVVRFTKDWRRVRCMDPDVDIEMLKALEADLEHRLSDDDQGAAFLAMLEDTLSNSLQLTRPQACLAENLAAQMDTLMRLYVESQKREPVSRTSTRQSIYGVMRREFERAGVWSFMDKQIPVTRFIGGADPLRIDCSYRNGGMRMFQAISSEDIVAVKALAFTVPALSRGVFEEMGMELELTAIGETLVRTGTSGNLSKNEDQLALYESGIRILEGANIRFMTTARLPEIVERAKQELGI
jgi:hypothetical protein